MESMHSSSTQTRWRERVLSLLPILRGLPRIAVAALFYVAMLLGTARQAHAASTHLTQASVARTWQLALTPLQPAAPSLPLVSCSGTNCNGANPNSTGCSADGYIVPVTSDGGYAYYYLGPGSSQGDGYMNLMYSPNCGTNWSYVNNDFPSSNRIEAQVDNLSTDYYYWSSCYDCSEWNSLMTYAPTSPAEADGWIVDPYWPNGLLIQPCLTQGKNTCWTNLPH